MKKRIYTFNQIDKAHKAIHWLCDQIQFADIVITTPGKAERIKRACIFGIQKLNENIYKSSL